MNSPSKPKELPRLPCDMTCKCGHTAWWERFNEDDQGEELPPSIFRCPGCGWMWERTYAPAPEFSNSLRAVVIKTLSYQTSLNLK
jgi:hypothetical protein